MCSVCLVCVLLTLWKVGAPLVKWPVPKAAVKISKHAPKLSKVFVSLGAGLIHSFLLCQSFNSFSEVSKKLATSNLVLGYCFPLLFNVLDVFHVGIPFYDFQEYIKNNPDGVKGWDQTFRVKNWKESFFGILFILFPCLFVMVLKNGAWQTRNWWRLI